jgi:hypothetical protein
LPPEEKNRLTIIEMQKKPVLKKDRLFYCASPYHIRSEKKRTPIIILMELRFLMFQ